MGRYRQWLYHQEIDRQLYIRLQHLETELAQLQEPADTPIANTDTLSGENQIILALVVSMDANMLPTVSPDIDTGPISPATHHRVLPALPHDELSLQPADMTPSFDGESPTEPQRELPRWLYTLIASSLNDSSVNPESIRSNRLFQRWSERWGQLPVPIDKAQKQQLPRKERES